MECLPAKYRRLNLEDREEISRGLAMGSSISHMARILCRHRSTVSREIRVAGMNRWKYRAARSQRRSHRNASKRRLGKHKLAANPSLWNHVQILLKKFWSPEQIENHLKLEYPHDTTMNISHEAIYSYVYVMPRGALKKELIRCLRRQHKRRQKKSYRFSHRGSPNDMTLIDERPKEVLDRTIPGHWEGDLILGREARSMLGTLVERQTRYLMLVRLKSKGAEEVRKSFARKIRRLPTGLRRTLTYDQGTEMAQHKLFAKDTKMKVYFAHPQSPWERGSNEHTNGLLRQFFPRGTDFSKININQIRRVEYLMNDRPRRVLNWLKPRDAMAGLLR